MGKKRIENGSQMDKELKQMVAKEIAGMAAEEISAGPVILGPDGGRLADSLESEAPRPPRRTSSLNLAVRIGAGLELPEGAVVDYQPDQEYVFLAEGGEDIDYIFATQVSAENPKTLAACIDAAIAAAREPFRHDGIEIFLHAVQGIRDVRRLPGQNKFVVNPKYIFRVRPIEAGSGRR